MTNYNNTVSHGQRPTRARPIVPYVRERVALQSAVIRSAVAAERHLDKEQFWSESGENLKVH
jgi:hypothetical protein